DDTGGKKKYTISGRLVSTNGKSGNKIMIAAFNKNLRSETEIGRKETTASGLFSIDYEPVFRKSEYKTADVFFRLYENKKEIKDFTVAEVINTAKNVLQNGILVNADATSK